GEPGDGEDVLVVLGQSRGGDPAALGAGAAEDADDEGDARRVDVVDAGEVEKDGPRVACARLVVRRLERCHGVAVDLAVEDDDRDAAVRGPDLVGGGHRCSPSASAAASSVASGTRTTRRTVWRSPSCSCVTASTMFS